MLAFTLLLAPLLFYITPLLAIDRIADPAGARALLRPAPPEPDRLRTAELRHDADRTFDFFSHEFYTYAPGGVATANAATFPAAATAAGGGLTMAWISLGPCAMLPPHYHPRGANYVVAVAGETDTWMVAENGAPVVRARLAAGRMTIFPTGSLHAMQNNGCDNATLISALSSDDTGTHDLLVGLFKLPQDMVAAAFGHSPMLDPDRLAALAAAVPGVGTGAHVGLAACLRRCGL